MSVLYRDAIAVDAEPVAALINSAYRGDHSRLGWTTEADLLDGRRTDAEEIRRLIARPESRIVLCEEDDGIVGSVHIEKAGDHASLSLFVVEPTRQGRGIGKHLLTHAEQVARQAWQVDRMVMYVISRRHDLMAFYNRRGYRRTGVLHEFPVNPMMWQPKVTGLMFEVLEKELGSPRP